MSSIIAITQANNGKKVIVVQDTASMTYEVFEYQPGGQRGKKISDGKLKAPMNMTACRRVATEATADKKKAAKSGD